MKKTIPFDIKYRPQIESGEYKVQTRCGENVRILDWNIHGDHPIVAEIWEEQDGVVIEESIRVDSFTTFGCAWANPPEDKLQDNLVLVTEEPEPELTEFEQAIQNMMRPYVNLPVDIIRRNASELLDLAKKEIFNDCTGWYLYWGDGKVTYEGSLCIIEEKADKQ